MTTKKVLGQYFTTNFEYILSRMNIPNNITNIIEPFAGNGDLINFIEKDKVRYNIECYDIEPKQNYIIQRDTIKNPPDYNNKFLLTNPPYLARNKSKDKTMFDKYNVNDLYKCVIKELIINICLGGIIIIPLNFWSSIRLNDINLRRAFMEIYDIILINIFEEQVFNDTTYTICSIQFTRKQINDNNKINIVIYPSERKIKTRLNELNNYMIGGGIYHLQVNNVYKITRLTSKNMLNMRECITNILVKCIDDNKNNKIRLSMTEEDDIYIDNTPNQTARTYATLVIEPKIDKYKQENLVTKFNEYLEKYREKYNSLFLTNYRESKDIARKRISFDLVYAISGYLLEKIDSK